MADINAHARSIPIEERRKLVSAKLRRPQTGECSVCLALIPGFLKGACDECDDWMKEGVPFSLPRFRTIDTPENRAKLKNEDDAQHCFVSGCDERSIHRRFFYGGREGWIGYCEAHTCGAIESLTKARCTSPLAHEAMSTPEPWHSASGFCNWYTAAAKDAA